MEIKTKQKEETKLRETCDACGLPKSDVKGTSLTGWIFARSCHCLTSPIKVSEVEAEEKTRVLTDINDRYETLEVIGKGGMGTVYRVKDRTLDKEFALKVLRPELAGDKEARTRFKQEISAAQNLSNPNLVSVYDFGMATDGSPFFVMDYVDGKNLADILKDEKTLNLKRCIDILLQVCEALAHAHEHGIIHRDLKPSNVIISTTGDGTEVVKVVDFGIAKILPPPGKDTVSLTKTAEIFGSPAYMSPEQCKGERVDRRCDVYAFGCVMFECLIGQSPFVRDNAVKTILAHVYDQPPSVRSKLIGYSAPDAVAAVVNRCLSKDPADRYDSVRELISDLECLRDGKPPVALTRISKEKSRRQMKFRALKYFPQTLTLITIAMILMAVQDSPWLLALAELNQHGTLHQEAANREAMSNQLVEKADDYNKPYALFMGAEADMQTGLGEAAKEKAAKSFEIFKQRKDLPDALIASRVLFTQYLREHNPTAALNVALSLNPLQYSDFKIPKKGMRLLGWFYLPSYQGQLTEMQEKNVDSFVYYGENANAAILVKDCITTVQNEIAKQTDKKKLRSAKLLRTFWQGKLVRVLQCAGQNDAAIAAFGDYKRDFVTDQGSSSQKQIKQIAAKFLASGDFSRAAEVLDWIESTDFNPQFERDLMLATCYDQINNHDKAHKLYGRAAQWMNDHNYWNNSAPLATLGIAGALQDARGPEAVKGFYQSLLDAVDRIPPDKSILIDESDVTLIKLSVLNEYATAMSLNGYSKLARQLRSQAETQLPRHYYNYKEPLWMQLANGYMLDADYRNANRILQTMIKDKVSHSKSTDMSEADQLYVANTIALCGDNKRAEEMLQEVIRRKDGTYTGCAEALTSLANIAASTGDFKKAREYYQKSLDQMASSLSPSEYHRLNTYNRLQFARLALAENNTYTEGIGWFKNSLANGDHTVILQREILDVYSKLLANSGDAEGAKIAQQRMKSIRAGDTTGNIMQQILNEQFSRALVNDFILNPLQKPSLEK
jgi:serine/threonine protein kinase/Tfp pilus assembly protein PilF